MTQPKPVETPETDWSQPRRTDTRGKGSDAPRVRSTTSHVTPLPRVARTPRATSSASGRTARLPGAAAGARAGRAPRVPFAVLVLSLVVGGMALLLVLNTASAANELDRRGLATQDAGVAAQVEQLRNEVAASAAPGNLARAAQNLGMVPAANPAFLVISADGSVVVRGSAAPVAPDAVPVPPASTKSTTAAKSTKSAKPTKSTTAAKSTKSGKATKPADSTSAKAKNTASKSAKPNKHTSAPTRPSSTTNGGGNR